MTDACEVEEGARGREKVNSCDGQKKPEDAGGNPDASTDLDSGVGSSRGGAGRETHVDVWRHFLARNAGSNT
jgi:hypothetical protein